MSGSRSRIPGTAGDTNDPDLVSTELVNGGDSD